MSLWVVNVARSLEGMFIVGSLGLFVIHLRKSAEDREPLFSMGEEKNRS